MKDSGKKSAQSGTIKLAVTIEQPLLALEECADSMIVHPLTC